MKPGNFPGAVENGDGPVPIFEDSRIGFEDSRIGFDEVMSGRAFRDLQRKTAIANAIVGRDDAFLLDAQDIGEIADKGNEGRSRLRPAWRQSGRCGEGYKRLEAKYWPPRCWSGHGRATRAANGSAKCPRAVRSARVLAGCKTVYAGFSGRAEPGQPGSVASHRSCRLPRACKNNGCRGRYRATKTGHGAEWSRIARESSRRFLLPQPEKATGLVLSHHPSWRSDRAWRGLQAKRGWSLLSPPKGCRSIIPGNGLRRRLRRCLARAVWPWPSRPRDCRTLFVQLYERADEEIGRASCRERVYSSV